MEEFINGVLSIPIKILCYFKISPYLLGQILSWIISLLFLGIVISICCEILRVIKNLIFGKDEKQD